MPSEQKIEPNNRGEKPETRKSVSESSCLDEWEFISNAENRILSVFNSSPKGLSRGEDCVYTEHVVLPTDTMQGICLNYQISETKLRQANQFSGSNLSLAPSKLFVPLNGKRKGYSSARISTPGGSERKVSTKTQDRNSNQFKLNAFLFEMPHVEVADAKAYLDLSVWNLHDALSTAKEDSEWDKSDFKESLLHQDDNVSISSPNQEVSGSNHAIRISPDVDKGASIADENQPLHPSFHRQKESCHVYESAAILDYHGGGLEMKDFMSDVQSN
eukprot:CAMPEP_0195519272 /NCGR_PEP_ID=MMETSP0794_2-20130614/14550_1 /TAXON_ID=515487 /ORGANISM="Stephanopyxis turris, Strain CCMP 815" /LENGTH=272 /DNA_ID=CAMNT_0040648395 /DNA_START=34 /DNA_END=852 /DNA_ORIENTATION=-